MNEPTLLFGVMDNTGHSHIVAVFVDGDIYHEIMNLDNSFTTAEFENFGDVMAFLNS